MPSIPGLPVLQMDSTGCNYGGFLFRHLLAFLFYGSAFANWPGLNVAKVYTVSDRPFGYGSCSLLFTFSLWNAGLFHYMVSLGRIKIDFKKGIRYSGWLVTQCRRIHRFMLAISLATAMSLLLTAHNIQTTLEHIMIDRAATTKGAHEFLTLLRINQGIGLFTILYILFRLSIEPVGIKRRENKVRKTACAVPLDNNQDFNVEECTICRQSWANRKLDCGHLICCCCLKNINMNGQFRCPYCRADIECPRRLAVKDAGIVSPLTCCDLSTRILREL